MYLHELKNTFKLATPLIVSQLLSYAFPVIDTIMAGRESPLILASVSLGAQIFTSIFLFMLGLAVAITTMVARYNGANDSIKIRRSFQQGVWLCALLAVLTFFLTAFAAQIPTFIGTSSDIAEHSGIYLRTLAFGASAAILALAARYFLEGMNAPQYVIKVQLCLIPVNIVGNYLLLKGFLFIPPLGAQGMAIATALCYFLYCIAMFWSIWKEQKYEHLRLFHKFAAIDFKEIISLLKIGVPIGIANIMESGLFLIMSLIVSRYGTIIAGANQIAQNYAGIPFMFPLGLAYALTVRTSNVIGAKDFNALKRISYGGLIFAFCMMFILGLLTFIFAPQITTLYSKNLEIYDISVKILMIVGVWQLFDGMQICAVGILRGLQDTKMAMYFAILGYWIIGLPTGLLLAYVFNLGIYGLWGGLCVGLFMNSVLSTSRVIKLIKD